MLNLYRLSTTALIALAVPVGIGLSACGGESPSDQPPKTATRNLDTAKIELAIAESIQEQRDVTANVSCPAAVRQAKGVSFVCDATTKRGTTPFVVSQKDAKGNVSFVAAEGAPTEASGASDAAK